MGSAPSEACRPATPEDVPRLVELVAAAVNELSSAKGGGVWARREARRAPYDDLLREQIAAADHRVLVATLDGLAMGYGVAHIEVLPDSGRLAVVTDLYTEPGCRELGLGEATMQALVDWAEAEGCFGVDSLALPGDRATKNFFESFGLVARAIVVHRRLG
jgi:GNAT superfamily N-acetyltransferase